MLLLCSPRFPGIHYKVETDIDTIHRVKTVISTEVSSGTIAEADADDTEERCDSGLRF